MAQPRHWTSQRKEQAAAALERACDEITPRLSDTPLAWRAEGRRHVVLWHSVEWSVRDDGTELRCQPVHGYGDFFIPSTDLRSPVSSGRWPNAFGAVLVDACNAAGLNPKVLPGPTGDWLRSSLRRTFRDFAGWNDLRRDLLRWLALDPLTLAIHRRIFEDELADIHTFNWVHRHLRHLSLVAVERPHLLPFLRRVHNENDMPLQALERVLREAGMTPKAFAWMEKVGFPAFNQDEPPFDRLGWPRLIARHANLLERLKLESPAPVVNWVLWQWQDRLPDWFFRALQRESQRLLDEGYDEHDADPGYVEEVIRWIRETRPEPDANQRRAGWAWLQAQALRERVHAAERAQQPPPCPYAAFTHEGLAVVPLTSVAELREEALAMNNCLEGYAYALVIGDMQPFSVREPGTGRRVASFMLSREGMLGHWAVLQVAGPSNGEAPDAATAAAAVACEQCNRVDAEERRTRHMQAKARVDAAENAAYEKAMGQSPSPPASRLP